MILSSSSRKSRQPLAKAPRAFSHHALLCIGPHEECLARIPLPHRSGVDAEVLITEQLQIDEARALSERASSRPIHSEKRRFVISCRNLTREAQNALLKLFEDPPATAQFYLIVPRASALLPTLRSRLHLFYEASAWKNANNEQTVSFLQATCNERLLQIAKLAKKKDIQAMRALINGIERAVAGQVRKKDSVAFLPDVLLASGYSETRGASHKMLLEHLALSIPEDIC